MLENVKLNRRNVAYMKHMLISPTVAVLALWIGRCYKPSIWYDFCPCSVHSVSC